METSSGQEEGSNEAAIGCLVVIGLVLLTLYGAGLLLLTFRILIVVLLIGLGVKFYINPDRDFRFEPNRLKQWRIRRREERQEKLQKAEAEQLALREQEELRVKEELKQQQREERRIKREQKKRQLEEDLARQQGIWIEQQMQERMQEMGLPRMAANAIDFELLAAQWIYVWGDREFEITPQSHDGGIDVRSWCCLGQVKFYSDSKVRQEEVQQLKGAASIDSTRDPVFFSFCSGYTNEALSFANQAGIGLFQFSVSSLSFECVNDHAVHVKNHLHSLL